MKQAIHNPVRGFRLIAAVLMLLVMQKKWNGRWVVALAGAVLTVAVMAASGGSLPFNHNSLQEQETQPC